MSNKIKKTSFLNLLENCKIEIPIIQRDYAQGRIGQEEIREKFLEDIFEALCNEKELELDFIYGSIKNNVFQPLDGQQRLTTLFLLHWFIAAKENKLTEGVKNILLKFTYKTRTSSREFCCSLIEKGIKFNKLLESDFHDTKKINSKNNGLSKTIINSHWFFLSWQKDPTIKAMLTMLDAIYVQYMRSNKDIRFWDRLDKINFHYIELENFGLSDDLYIKMNARGKALTEFENFKAKFEQHIKEKNWERETQKIEETFAHKIDTVWTDLFWKYRNKNNNLFDKELMNFIAGIAINNYAVNDTSKKKNEKEEVEKRIAELANDSAKTKPEDFEEKGFNYLVACLNKYAEIKDESPIKPTINLWNYNEKQKTLFEDFINAESNYTYPMRVLFFAQTEYLLNNSFEQSEFDEWMRVIRNIIENSTIDTASTFASAIKLVKELSAGSDDIYDYLSKNKVKSGHAGLQLKEEIAKAKIIITNPDARLVIHETEDTNFCKGRIEFALYCTNYDIENPNITFDKDKLKSICNVISEHLSGNDVTNKFRRAFFTIKNNDFYDYWTRSCLHAVNAPKRKIITDINDLKRNFVFKGKNDYDVHNNNRDYLKELILKLSTNEIGALISEYISKKEFSDLPNWKKRIIKEEHLLEHSRSHYIAIKEDEDNSCCWLIPGSRVANNRDGRAKLKKIE